MTEIVESMHREIMLRPIGRFNENHLKTGMAASQARLRTRTPCNADGSNNLSSGLRLYKNVARQTSAQPLPASLKNSSMCLMGVMGDHLVGQW